MTLFDQIGFWCTSLNIKHSNAHKGRSQSIWVNFTSTCKCYYYPLKWSNFLSTTIVCSTFRPRSKGRWPRLLHFSKGGERCSTHTSLWADISISQCTPCAAWHKPSRHPSSLSTNASAPKPFIRTSSVSPTPKSSKLSSTKVIQVSCTCSMVAHYGRICDFYCMSTFFWS